MPQEIDAADLKNTKRSLMQVGPPLAGKTRALLTCPRPVWIIDLDENSGSIADAPRGAIRVFRFETAASAKVTKTQHRPQSSVVLTGIIDFINGIWDLPADKKPATLAIDSLGKLGHHAMEFVLALNQRKEPVYQDWGQAQAKIREILEACVTLSCNFVLNAHEATEKDELLGRIETIPDTIGKLARQLGGLFDAVVYARRETNPKTQLQETTWLTCPDGFVKSAGVRDKILPKQVPADWKQLFPQQEPANGRN